MTSQPVLVKIHCVHPERNNAKFHSTKTRFSSFMFLGTLEPFSSSTNMFSYFSIHIALSLILFFFSLFPIASSQNYTCSNTNIIFDHGWVQVDVRTVGPRVAVSWSVIWKGIHTNNIFQYLYPQWKSLPKENFHFHLWRRGDKLEQKFGGSSLLNDIQLGTTSVLAAYNGTFQQILARHGTHTMCS